MEYCKLIEPYKLTPYHTMFMLFDDGILLNKKFLELKQLNELYLTEEFNSFTNGHNV
jgi:hypothetical protein